MNQLILYTAFIFAFALSAADIRQEHVFLLSFPGSGNTWLRYCIEFITKRPTGELSYLVPMEKENRWLNCPINNNFPMGVDYDAPPVIKIHDTRQREKPFASDNDYLIMIVRNYKETVLRYWSEDVGRAVAMLKDPNNFYTKALRDYHAWAADKKLLIYYEDLIQFPEQTFRQLADFFRVSPEYIPFLMKNFSEHKEKVIAVYERDFSRSVTRGEDIHFHGNALSQEDRLLLDQICEEADPELFQTYLLHYKEGRGKRDFK